jgi:uncharacterized protein (DUF1778 family)
VGGKAYQMKTLRLHPEEEHAIERACSALNSLDRASLMSEAACFHAMRLGVYYSADPPPPLKASWPYIPERGDEPTGVRLTITMSISVEELVARAARHVHTSEPLFIIGSTLAYIGRLATCYTGSERSTPEEAAEIRKKLQAIKLPAQYQYRRRAKR